MESTSKLKINSTCKMNKLYSFIFLVFGKLYSMDLQF